MSVKPVDETHAARSRALFDLLIEPLRARARELGYALCVHGSLRRDIDLVAVPWTEDAVTPNQLFEALIEEARRTNDGLAFLAPHEQNEFPRARPHGRRAWSIHLGGGPYIDLSVMSPSA